MKTFNRVFAVMGALALLTALAVTVDVGHAATALVHASAFADPAMLFTASAVAAGANPDAIKASVEKLMKGWEDFQASNDENLKKRDVLLDEKLARINKELDKFEPLNQTITAQQAEAKKLAEEQAEIKAGLERIETAVNRPKAPAEATADQKKFQAFFDWARYGDHRQDKVPADRLNVLTVSDDTGGGYLCPPEYVAEITKAVVEHSPMRPIVRVRSTSQKSMQLPKRTGVFAARWTGEIEERTETQGLAYGMDDVPAHEMTAEVYISMVMLEDSAFDMEAELRMEFAEQFGVLEGAAIISGNAVKKPEGFLSASGSAAVNSGAATTVTADGILSLKYAIKTAYARNGTFVLNRSTLGSIRKLKDGNGQYLWAPGLAQGRPNAIDGDPYVEAPDMPNEGAGAKCMAFGDWRRAYTLIDRLAISVQRDPFTRASVGQIKFVARRRIGGAVVLPEAFGVMTCA
ncbi:MAG TPA: phage major capsid protein [Beijerinckiaceae bacterium]|nr:phage major capsid protein [Beijerinckiaceae bacterium]